MKLIFLLFTTAHFGADAATNLRSQRELDQSPESVESISIESVESVESVDSVSVESVDSVSVESPDSVDSVSADSASEDGEEAEAALGVAGDSGNCFGMSNTVDVLGKGIIGIGELQIGDYAKSAAGDYSRVISFGHLDKSVQVDYLNIQVGESKLLEVSNEHMLLTHDGKAVRADSIEQGDNLWSGKVASIEKRLGYHLYAPVTEAGTIEVSGVAASCYGAVMNANVQMQNWVFHNLYAPLRVACRFDFDICKSETYGNGFSSYLSPLTKVLSFLKTFAPSMESASLIALGTVTLLFAFVEKVVMNFVLVVLAVGAAYVTFKPKNTKKID